MFFEVLCVMFCLYKAEKFHRMVNSIKLLFWTIELIMSEEEIIDTETLLNEGINVENHELDLREKEIGDEEFIPVMQSDKMKGITALFLEFNKI